MMSFSLINPLRGLPWWLRDKESSSNAGAAGDMGLIPGSRRFPGEGNGYPLQYSWLENPHGQRCPCGLQSIGSQRVRHG